MIALASAAPPALASNPQIPQGGTGSFPPTGTQSASTGTWQVWLGTNLIASSSNPNGGWNVSWNSTTRQITVTVAPNAQVTTNYLAEVNAGIQPGGPGFGVGGSGESGYFDVTQNGGGVLSLSLSVQVAVGGTGFTGTVLLASPAPSGGATISLQSSNTAVATVSVSSITIPQGQTWGTFGGSALTQTSNQYCEISASYSSATAFQYLLVITPGLTLTGSGTPGLGLSLFTAPFTPSGGLGPFACFATGAEVLVTDYGQRLLRELTPDLDGQNASYAAPQTQYTYPFDVVMLDDKLYMTDVSDVYQVNANTSSVRRVVTTPQTAYGLCADPFRHVLYISTGKNSSTIYRLDPASNTLITWVSGLAGPDGMVLSPDGTILYVALDGGDDVAGISTSGAGIVWDYKILNPGNPLPDPDGISIGTGVLGGNLYVNCNTGQVYEIALATGIATLIANNGTRGDFATADPNGSLFLSQVDRIYRLQPPPGGGFMDVLSSTVATRDDGTNPNTSPYSAFNLTYPAVQADSSQKGGFDFTSLGGGVEGAFMQRGGQISWSGTGVAFDLTLGLHSSTYAPLYGNGSTFPSFQNNPNPGAYTSSWSMPLSSTPGAFEMDLQNALGGIYQPYMTDGAANTSGSYTITDTPESGWPTLSDRNILTAVDLPYGNPAIAQGRALDITMPWTDQPANGTWDIVQESTPGSLGTVIASSANPNGWNVESDHGQGGAWITVPAGASTGVSYEARLAAPYGAGFFDVVNSTTTAPVMLPLTATATTIVGGNDATGTVTLDAPAPTGGATVTIESSAACLTVPASVTIAGGHTSATYSISTAGVTSTYGVLIAASFNGVRALPVVVLPVGGGQVPGAPSNLTAVGGVSEVTLAWGQGTPVSDSFNVYRGLQNGGPYTKIASGLIKMTFVDTNVTNGTTYYYVVTGVNPYGESSYSNEASATPEASVPIYSITLTATSVLGGQPSIGTVTLSSGAPPGGESVSLTSSNTAVVTVPTTVTVPQGANSTQFAATTYPVTANTQLTLTATAGSSKAQATLTVEAPYVVSVSLSPDPVTGGTNSTGTVTLASAAPTGAATLSLSSSNTSVATVPATVTVPANSDTANFTVTTVAVNAATAVTITAQGKTNCNTQVSASAGLSVLPASVNVYLAGISVAPTGIVGSGTATGTVTLSGAAPAGGAVVLLRSNSADVTVPASVSVSAGNQTASFSVTDAGVSAETYATVVGSYNTWTQSCLVTAEPSGYSLDAQNVLATGGNGMALVRWMPLAPCTVQGYNVYRIVSGQPVLLTASPVGGSEYVDSGLTNGQQYAYEVASIHLDGTVGAYSTAASATTLGTAPTCSWVNPPQTLSGDAELYATMSDGTTFPADVLVDGANAGSTDSGEPGFDPPDLVYGLSTDSLQNTVHTIQICGVTDSGSAFASPVIQLTTSNDMSSFFCSPLVGAEDGSVSQMSATLTTDVTSWTVEITRDSDGAVIRSWQGSGTSVSAGWDGTDATGAPVPDDDYSAVLTTYVNGQQKDKKRVHLIFHQGCPNFLGLMTDIDGRMDDGATPPKTPHEDQLYEDNLNAAMQTFERNYGGGFTHKVTMAKSDTAIPVNPPRGQPPTRQMLALVLQTIRTWMQTGVTDFYVFGHCNVWPDDHTTRFIQWGVVQLLDKMPSVSPAEQANIRSAYNTIVIPDLFSGGGRDLTANPYNFVFLDGCYTAGGGLAPPTPANGYAMGAEDDTWAAAFQIDDTAWIQAFLGWNGEIAANSWAPPGTYSAGKPYQVSDSAVRLWRQSFWNWLVVAPDGAGRLVSDSVSAANRQNQPYTPPMPQDANRTVQLFDTTWP